MVADGTRVAVLTDDPSEAHRSRCELAVVAPVEPACAALAARVAVRAARGGPPLLTRPPDPAPPAAGEPLTAAHVLAALARRLPVDAVLVEETPSSQPELYRRIAVRTPGGFVAGGNGGLGFGVAGSIGLAMGDPSRPVVGVIGDGSSLYAIQALWSAARYGVGVLLVVMANGRYAVMDGLARAAGAPGPWGGFETVDVAAIARGFGCPAVTVDTHDALLQALDDVLPGLAARTTPLVLVASIAA